jgi:hypothetical protein
MKKVIVVEKDTKISKNMALSEGDMFVKTNLGWLLVEAEEGDEEDKKEDDEEDMKEEEEDSAEDEKEDKAEDKDKKEESKKK